MCPQFTTKRCAVADPKPAGGVEVSTKSEGATVPGGLRGKIALVTGSDSGIGKAIALELAAAGVDVAVTFHSDESGAELAAAAVREAGRRAIVAALDVSDADSVAACVEKVNQELGAIDILVNNAGINGDSAPLASVEVEEWDRVIATNLRGVFLCTRAVLKDMIAARKGVILNITSVHETIPWAAHAAYCASKAAVGMLTRTLALELQDSGIRAVALAPGAIATPMNTDTLEDPKAMADLRTKIPLQRVGEVEEIARIARMLVSDEASYVTGTTVFADGGMSAYPSFSQGG